MNFIETFDTLETLPKFYGCAYHINNSEVKDENEDIDENDENDEVK